MLIALASPLIALGQTLDQCPLFGELPGLASLANADALRQLLHKICLKILSA